MPDHIASDHSKEGPSFGDSRAMALVSHFFASGNIDLSITSVLVRMGALERARKQALLLLGSSMHSMLRVGGVTQGRHSYMPISLVAQ